MQTQTRTSIFDLAAPHSSSAFLSPERIRDQLREALNAIPFFDECALLDYPNFYNAGDHLIWLGCLFWILMVRRKKIQYISSYNTLKPGALRGKPGPIFLSGGGNFGDIWPHHQNFRERVILENPGRPVVIFPQSVHFADARNLERAKRIFNSHPDVTLFLRDSTSLLLASEYFPHAKCFLAPDMAFMLCDVVRELERGGAAPVRGALLHQRADRECAKAAEIPETAALAVEVRDWCTFNGFSRIHQRLSCRFPFLWRGVAAREAELWAESRRGIVLPSFIEELKHTAEPGLHFRSLDLVRQVVHQFQRYRLIISTRLHGHILSALMKKPNILLPNSYHKNRLFFETWTNRLAGSRFLAEESTPALDS